MNPDVGDSANASRIDAIATHWSLVREAHAAGKPQNATMARQVLVLRYARAIRRYIGGIVKNTTDADELAQDVILRLMAGDFAGADPNRGRFRDLLKTAIRNMVHNHWAKANRRRPVDVDLALVESDSGGLDAEWDNAWRQTVLDHAWAALKEHQRTNPGSSDFTLLQMRRDFPDLDSEGLAAKLAAQTGNPVRSDTCRQMLRRARIRFSEFLLQEVGAGLTEPSKDRVAEELAALGLLEYLHDFLEDK
jgi:DNA-directed RNA polymerase specialized sigma24 family protein